MKKRLFALTLLSVTTLVVCAQNFTISGVISYARNGETIIGAAVFDRNSEKGVVSNTYGFYSLTLPTGNVFIRYAYVGCRTQELEFHLSKDTVINISLEESNLLQEVVISGRQKETGVHGSQMGAIEVPVAQIKAVPTLFGENDLIKALQLLPGVQGGTEGFTGFYVRGGGPDQNLYLLDGVPLYNVNHLGGFFSAFNTDAIKNITLYKGGFPARFGSRLSSVLDIRMNDGNNKKLKGSFGIGLISCRMNLEGPLFGKKTTFNISARRTYIDVLTQPAIRYLAKQEGFEKLSAGYYFYDLNAKVSHKLSEQDRLFISFYTGDDVAYMNMKDRYQYSEGDEYDVKRNYTSNEEARLNMNWGNLLSVVRWNRILHRKLFMDATATYTRYRFNTGIGSSLDSNNPNEENYNVNMSYKSGIEDFAAKLDFDFAPNPAHDINPHCVFRP